MVNQGLGAARTSHFSSRLERRGKPVVGAQALRDALGRTRAMLSIPLDRLNARTPMRLRAAPSPPRRSGVTYALEFTDPGREDFQRLDVWLQEETLDELDRLMDLHDHFMVDNEPGYSWVHPSWRDLVIEYLSASTQERRDFLAQSSIYGIMLAISGGGATGRRAFPLLLEPEDWAALESATSKFVATASLPRNRSANVARC